MNPETASFLPGARKDFSRIGWALFAIIGLASLIQIAFVFLPDGFPQMQNAPLVLWLLTFLPLYLVGVPVGLLIMKKLPAEKKAPQKLPLGHFLQILLLCFPIMYVGNLIGTALSFVLSFGSADNVLMEYVMNDSLYTLIFAVILAPVLEEFIFRKFLLDRTAKYGELTAMLFSGIAFGLFHTNLFQFFYAFGLGLVFAYVYIRTRMVRYPIVMHMVINFQGSIIAPWVLTLLNSVDPSQMDATQIMEFLPELMIYMLYSTIFMLVLVLGVVFLVLRWKKRAILPAEQEIPRGFRFKTVYLNAGVIVFSAFCIIMTLVTLFSAYLP